MSANLSLCAIHSLARRATHKIPRDNRCSCLQMTLRSPLVAVSHPVFGLDAQYARGSATKRKTIGISVVAARSAVASAVPVQVFAAQKQRIIALAADRHLPTIYGSRTLALEGGLISYGSDLRENLRRGATYMDSILKGALPRDLPVYQPSRLELVLNVKAAKALGLTIPSAILLRADEVIE